MKIDENKISQIQTVLRTDDAFVEFTENKFKDGLWYVSNNNINKFGKSDPEEGAQIEQTYSQCFGDRPMSEFFEEIKGKDLKARIFLGRLGTEEEYQQFSNWQKLASAIGVSDLVTVATKIPKVVAKRFEIFANQKSDRSNVLRELVYKYVEKCIVEQVKDLMFKEKI